jgi:hypothetical protein
MPQLIAVAMYPRPPSDGKLQFELVASTCTMSCNIAMYYCMTLLVPHTIIGARPAPRDARWRVYGVARSDSYTR